MQLRRTRRFALVLCRVLGTPGAPGVQPAVLPAAVSDPHAHLELAGFDTRDVQPLLEQLTMRVMLQSLGKWQVRACTRARRWFGPLMGGVCRLNQGSGRQAPGAAASSGGCPCTGRYCRERVRKDAQGGAQQQQTI